MSDTFNPRDDELIKVIPQAIAVGCAFGGGRSDELPAPPIDFHDQLDTLRKVSAQFCFDLTCPICGVELCAGDRHECRLASGPLETVDQTQGYTPGHD